MISVFCVGGQLFFPIFPMLQAFFTSPFARKGFYSFPGQTMSVPSFPIPSMSMESVVGLQLLYKLIVASPCSLKSTFGDQ